MSLYTTDVHRHLLYKNEPKLIISICKAKNNSAEKYLFIEIFRSLGICGFDYSRIRKHGKTANTEGNNKVLA